MQTIIYEKDILINRNKYTICINSYCWFVESNDQKIARSCLLYQLNEKDKATITSKNIDVTLYYRASGKQYFYIILVKPNLLFVVERLESNLKMVFNLKNVLNIKIEDRLNNGRAEVYIARESGETKLNEILESRKSFFEENSCFDQNREIVSKINTHKLISQRVFERVNLDLKFGLNCIRSLTQDEKVPLIKYGDVWTKTANDKIVIVVSLLNCTYGRPITLQNIRAVVDCIHKDDFDCSFQLFNIQTSTCDTPSISKNKKDFITPETEALLVLTTSHLNWTNCLRGSCSSNLFICYDTTKNDHTYSQQLFLDKISLNHNLWCEDIEDDKGTNTHSLDLKEFLLLTATSYKTQLQLLDDFSKEDFVAFLVTKLKFSIQTFLSDTDNVLIKSNGYWKNTMIRVEADQIDIYSRTKRYGEEFIKTIYVEFAQRCSIKPIMYATRTENLLGEFKRCLLNELHFNIKNASCNPSSELKINSFLNELRSDVMYLNTL